jgi:hypothetical protein
MANKYDQIIVIELLKKHELWHFLLTTIFYWILDEKNLQHSSLIFRNNSKNQQSQSNPKPHTPTSHQLQPSRLAQHTVSTQQTRPPLGLSSHPAVL